MTEEDECGHRGGHPTQKPVTEADGSLGAQRPLLGGDGEQQAPFSLTSPWGYRSGGRRQGSPGGEGLHWKGQVDAEVGREEETQDKEIHTKFPTLEEVKEFEEHHDSEQDLDVLQRAMM